MVDDINDDEIDTVIRRLITCDEVLDRIYYYQCPKVVRISREIVKNYWETSWGLLINNPNVYNSNSYEGKKFRRRFRVPFPLFKDVILPELINKYSLHNYLNECFAEPSRN